MNEFYEKILKCSDCGSEFVFTKGEAAFYVEKHFLNLPKRCRSCREKNKGKKRDGAETEIKCSGCGKTDTVPFEPTQGRPVFCRSCFNKHSQIGRNGKEFRGVSPEFVKSMEGEMNTEANRTEVARIYNKLTQGAFFSPDDRHQTKHILEKVLGTIIPKLEKSERDILQDLEICAPSPKTLCEAVPGNPTTVWLNPQIETEDNEEMAEYAVVFGLASGIRLSQGTGRNQLQQRTNELVKHWDYTVPASAKGGAVGATA